jgi:outer membrane protein OmpA-like peptidoglycan-associated protein
MRFLVASIVVIAVLLHNLPMLMRDQAVLWLLDNGAEKAELKAINVDWFAGRITIDRLHAEAQGKPQLSAEKLLVDLDLSKLTNQKILLTLVEIQGVNSGTREEGESLWLGPIDLNTLSSSEEKSEAESGSSSWSFGLSKLTLDEIQWRAEVAGQKHNIVVNSGQLADFYLWDHEQPVSINLDGALNGAPVVLSSSSKPLPTEKSSELSIKLNNFPVHSVTALFLPELKASVDLDLKINAKSDLESKATQIQQSGAIRVRDLQFSKGDLEVIQKALSWNGSVTVALKGNTLRNINSSSDITVQELDLKQAGQQVAADKLQLKTDFSMQGQNQIAVKGLDLSADSLLLKQAGKSISVNQLQLGADASSDDLSYWRVQSPGLTLDQLKLSGTDQELVSLGSAGINAISVDHTDKMSLGAINLNALKVMGDGGVFTEWQSVFARDLSLVKLSELSINQIGLQNSSTRVHLSEDRQLSDLDWLLAQLGTDEGPSVEKESSVSNEHESNEPETTEPFKLHIGDIKLSGVNKLELLDAGVKPVFKTEFDINVLELSQLDTSSDKQTAFLLKAKNKFSTLDAKGNIALFSGDYGGNWELDVKGLELPQVSPYSLQYTGYYMHSGQLNLTSKGTIKDRTLKGDSDIRLNKLEVEAQNTERSGEFDQKVSMPLGTAIMVLQDNDSNIDLQIPVDGSLDDPQFGYQTVINKLAGKGLKSAALGYLTKALQPFGTLISLSKMVVDAQSKGTFISLEPVYFLPGQYSLSAEANAYMQKIAQMMNERKAMRINICGTAVASDKEPVWTNLIESNKKKEKPLPEAELQKQLEPALQQLAEERSDAVKGLLSGQLGINIERLFSCYPKVDLKLESKPQVALGI